ncbi:allantoate permease [Sugiyamaella lignohabitans]|uniref:Allantoate permease n=1 Tax=Sugiyamaella lignohabitans TaxID=796027 RepID=A0A167C1L0_9ASCO|nr:allantoate permease [Sugiyamaella lignohabitans]ANB11104.1 allantoate permease [Sugiyamaella lignohabitans]
MGFKEDLNLVGNDFSFLGMFFYVGFLAAELPTQWLAQRISFLGKYLGINVTLWGVVLACHAACNSYAQVAVLRTLLGIFEACVAPILVLIICMWYKKQEQGKRVACFYVMNSFTSVAAGLIAYGASFTKSSFASWRIFLLCMGLVTVVCGVLVFLYLPDSPTKAKGFTDEEKLAVLLRIKDDQSGTQNNKLKGYQMLEAVSDPKVWLVVLSVMLISIPNGALSIFSSLIVNSFGFSAQETLIVGVPGGLLSGFWLLAVQYYSDKTQNRTLMNLCYLLPAILGLALMVGLENREKTTAMKTGLLISNYLSQTFGGTLALILSWNASNVAGHSKKVLVNALTFIAFPLGNIIGTQTFQAKDAPMYMPGKAAILGCLSLQCFITVGWYFLNQFYNNKKQRVLDEMDPEQRETMRRQMEFSDETDMRNPFFRYTK